MNILVTGISGFEGTNMALLLDERGHAVTGLDISDSIRSKELSGIPLREMDIRDEKLQKFFREFDAVCHLAGQVSHLYGQKDPKFDLDVNVNGMINILDGIRKYNPKCHLLYASSRSVYGFPKYMPIDEEHPTKPIDAYGISKMTAEHYIRLYQYHYGLRTTIFRQANLFGPRQQMWTSDFQMISWIFRCVMLEKPFTFYGDGTQTRDFLYIDDCVGAYIKALENPETAMSQVFNLGGKDYITWNELIRICEDVMVHKALVSYISYPRTRLKLENPHSVLSYFKAKQILGWTPMVGVKEGITKMAEYFDRETIEQYEASQK